MYLICVPQNRQIWVIWGTQSHESPVHASQQRAAACDLRQCWEGPCPSRARRLSPDVRRIASSGRTPSLSRGAAEPGRLKLCPTSPFRGGCAMEWIADESLSAAHRTALRDGGSGPPPGRPQEGHKVCDAEDTCRRNAVTLHACCSPGSVQPLWDPARPLYAWGAHCATDRRFITRASPRTKKSTQSGPPRAGPGPHSSLRSCSPCS